MANRAGRRRQLDDRPGGRSAAPGEVASLEVSVASGEGASECDAKMLGGHGGSHALALRWAPQWQSIGDGAHDRNLSDDHVSSGAPSPLLSLSAATLPQSATIAPAAAQHAPRATCPTRIRRRSSMTPAPTGTPCAFRCRCGGGAGGVCLLIFIQPESHLRVGYILSTAMRGKQKAVVILRTCVRLAA